MQASPEFALNHMVAPRLGHTDFFALARRLGIRKVEIRNDLRGIAIADGTPAKALGDAAAEQNIEIISINALQRFNDWNADREKEARELIGYAGGCGAAALVLCPVNDMRFTPGTTERLAGLRQALRGLKPLLSDAGIEGLIEPLGFAECSLRLKREALEAASDVDGENIFRVVHDTFHHHVAGEDEIFPGRTGLVHISGVIDSAVGAATMRDPHRVLVGRDDLLNNVAQVQALRDGGYGGVVSFEPFAASVHDLADVAHELASSIAFIKAGLRPAAA